MSSFKLPKHVYHLVEKTNWHSIERHGLLPTELLYTLSGYAEDERRVLTANHRPDHTVLRSGIEIRDQAPMPPAALEKCLIRMTPAEWYANLNSRVFFWLDIERLHRQRSACAPRPQMMLTFDTARLVEAYLPYVALSPINTGFARRKPAVRGEATFVPYSDWSRSGWESEMKMLGNAARKASHNPVELTVRRAIPDALKFVADIQSL